jgi:hypothetical protein
LQHEVEDVEELRRGLLFCRREGAPWMSQVVAPRPFRTPARASPVAMPAMV